MTTRFLEGKNALVTGGSRGIGAGIVRSLAEAGAHVTFTYASASAAADALVAELAGRGLRARAVRVDSADDKALVAAIAETAGQSGSLDIFVSSAGLLVHAPLAETSVDDYDRLFAVNVRAVFVGAKAAASFMGEGGSIISIGSISAERAGVEGAALYCSSKGAVQSMTRGLARDLGPRGITVNNVQPGPITTDMTEGYAEMLVPMIPVGRLGKPEEVGALVAFLAGPNARYINGASIDIDGGFIA